MNLHLQGLGTEPGYIWSTRWPEMSLPSHLLSAYSYPPQISRFHSHSPTLASTSKILPHYSPRHASTSQTSSNLPIQFLLPESLFLLHPPARLLCIPQEPLQILPPLQGSWSCSLLTPSVLWTHLLWGSWEEVCMRLPSLDTMPTVSLDLSSIAVSMEKPLLVLQVRYNLSSISSPGTIYLIYTIYLLSICHDFNFIFLLDDLLITIYWIIVSVWVENMFDQPLFLQCLS